MQQLQSHFLACAGTRRIIVAELKIAFKQIR